MLNRLQLLLAASLFVAAPLLGQQQGFVYVPGGTFVMGDHSGTGNADELPLHQVDIDGFWMHTREVAVSHFAYFLSAMGNEVESPTYDDAVRLTNGGREWLAEVKNSYWGYSYYPIYVSSWGGYLSNGGGIDRRAPHAVTYVSFYGAAAYANWLSEQSGYDPVYNQTTWATDYSANGYRLPTEAEWEYAARGGAAVAELYPWGNTLSGDNANYANSGDPWDNSSWGGTTPSGYYDGNQQPSGPDMANGFGLYDMIGNAREMCNDYYSSTYYSVSDPANPTGPASSAGDGRVIRGASYTAGLSTTLRTARRSNFVSEPYGFTKPDVGFRLVRNGASFLEISNLYAGEVAAIQVTGCMPNNVLKIAYSLTGSGPTPSPFGLADLSNPIIVLQTVVADSLGVASMSAPVPMSALGVPVWFQAANIHTGSLSNSLAKIIESNAVPVLFSASPNSSPQGSSLTVGVSGIYLVEDSEILIESTDLSVPLSNVDLLSSNYIEGDLNLAGVPTGVYTIKVIKPSGVYGELLNGFTVTNVAPFLTSCLPDFGLESTTAQITVTGDFIDQGASIELVQGANAIVGSSIQIAADGSTITADFALGTVIGLYDVVVTDTDGTVGVLPSAFDIVSTNAYSAFEMGNHGFVTGGADEFPVHLVLLDAFDVEAYECTNFQFAAYLNSEYAAGNITVSWDVVYLSSNSSIKVCELLSPLSFNGSTFIVATGKNQHPVRGVYWHGAVANANWRSVQDGLTPCYDMSTFICDVNANGWRLPSEAEWEYAARGGSNSPYFAYPWNTNVVTPADANCNSFIYTTCEVGLYPPNGFGLYDTSGNVYEYCNDWYSSNYYSVSPTFDPRGPNSGTYRTVRGGGYNSPASLCTSAARGPAYETSMGFYGFRLVKNL